MIMRPKGKERVNVNEVWKGNDALERKVLVVKKSKKKRRVKKWES